MRNSTMGLIGVGSALVDQLAHVPESFLARVPGDKGGMELVDAAGMAALVEQLPTPPTRAPGGSAANTMVGAAHLGLKTGFLTKVGADEAVDYYRAAAASAGVDVSPFKVSQQTPTGCCLSLITPDSQRTMRTFPGASATLTAEDVGLADFEGYSHAHLEGYLLFDEPLFLHLLTSARAAGCCIALDLAAREVVLAARPRLPQLLERYVDIVFANEDEAAAFSGQGSELAALGKLAGLCEIAVVKLGARGALVQRGKEVAQIEAPSVRAVDSTGAGDLWAAGFLCGLLNGASLSQAGQIGAALGAAVVQVTGAVLPEDTWVQLANCTRTLMPLNSTRGS